MEKFLWQISKGGQMKLSNPFNMRGIILMYHRVAKLDIDPWQLSVSPQRFKEMRRRRHRLERFCFWHGPGPDHHDEIWHCGH